jgi:Putative translation initiation inhibitor, yjgF family
MSAVSPITDKLLRCCDCLQSARSGHCTAANSIDGKTPNHAYFTALPIRFAVNLGRQGRLTKGVTIMLKTRNPPTVAPPAAMYSHSVEVPPNARWLFTAGQVGVRLDGTVAEGFEAQHDQIWRNTLAILTDSGMGPENIVRLNVYSTDPDGLKYLKTHREKYLKPGHTPASTWVVVSKLANPKWVVEMETVAAKA